MAFGTKTERQTQLQPAAARAGRSVRASPRRPLPGGFAGALLHLQRARGNDAVQRLLIQTRHDGDAGPAPLPVEEAVDGARGSGHVLDERVRDEMEGAFEADFGSVRIHTDTSADVLSRSVNAHAFTTGQDIFFRGGAYDPGSASGRLLLAHELTHVVQQTGDDIRPKLTIGAAGDEYEQEADRVARAIVALPPAAGAADSSDVPEMQRACAECEQELSLEPPGEE